MFKWKLEEVVESLTQQERDAIESVIINGAQGKTYGADMNKLARLGLVYLKDEKYTERWAYIASSISLFFSICDRLTRVKRDTRQLHLFA